MLVPNANVKTFCLQHLSRLVIIRKNAISTEDEVLVKIFSLLLSCTECPFCSKVEMAIPTKQLDDNSYQIHLVIGSDISSLDETQVPLDAFFDAALDIEQVCLQKFVISSIIGSHNSVPPMR